jgi:hypothetical protein
VELKEKYNHCIQLTVKSVTFFAKQKNAPLFTSADAGVSLRKAHNIQGNIFVIIAICSKFIVLVFEGAGVVWAFQSSVMLLHG